MSQIDLLLNNNAAYVAKGEVPQVNQLRPFFPPKGVLPNDGIIRLAVGGYFLQPLVKPDSNCSTWTCSDLHGPSH